MHKLVKIKETVIQIDRQTHTEEGGNQRKKEMMDTDRLTALN